MDESLLRGPGVGLRFLIEHDAFAVVAPLPPSSFVTYCKERGIDIDVGRLERLERLGTFYPIARVEYPRIQVKIERVGEQQIRSHGMLNNGEVWDGELREENSRFSFRREWALGSLEAGSVWDPRQRPFEAWNTFRRPGSWQPRVESFYSTFQAFTLKGFLTESTMRVPADVVAEWQGNASTTTFLDNLSRWADVVLRHARERLRGDGAVFIAQAIANRYYFHTQGDRRTIRVSENPMEPFPWEDCIRAWDASVLAGELGLDAEGLADMQRDIAFLASSDDPLERWYEIVSFVALEKREQLKGRARFAQLGYSIEHMLRFFYHDLTGKSLRPPHQRHAGVHVESEASGENILDELQYVVNQYHLNPKPRLLLVVEGDGEAQEFPRVARDLLGYDFAQVGIEVRNLRGIGEFTGSRKRDRLGALEKFIDDHHARQTIVFCILDNEGDAQRIRKRLIEAEARFVPGRKLTCEEYIHLWEDSVEFDNFSDEEIASALTRVCDGRAAFSAADVAAARLAKRTSGNPLHALYQARLAYDLNKVELLRELMNLVIADRQREAVDPPPRPIVALLLRVVELAATNFQPTDPDTWNKNQHSGLLGAPVPRKES